MKVVIGCTDGNTYESDDIPESVIQEELNKADGHIGEGGLEHIVCNTVDEFVKFMSDMVSGKEINGFTPTDITLVMNGRDRVFKPETIVWHEIVRD